MKIKCRVQECPKDLEICCRECELIECEEYCTDEPHECNNAIPVAHKSTHADICKRLTNMYNQKNADYGNSFKHTRSIIPNAILVRLNDKISRLNTLLTSDTQEVKSESIDDTLMDLANYCIMELMEREMENK